MEIEDGGGKTFACRALGLKIMIIRLIRFQLYCQWSLLFG